MFLIYILIYIKNLIYDGSDLLIISVLFLIFLIGAAFSNHGFSPLMYLVLTPFVFLASYIFVSSGEKTVLGALGYAYWALSFLVGILLIIYRDAVEPLGAILPWSSTNGIPSYLIVLHTVYSVAFFLINKKLPIASAIVLLAISFYGIGRGAIIISLLMVIISMSVNLFLNAPKINFLKIGLAALATLLAIIVLHFHIENIIDYIINFINSSRLSKGLLDEHRLNMLQEYMNKLSLIGFLFGQNYDFTVINTLYGGNPHNSLIRIHSFYGFFPLLLMILPILTVFVVRKNSIDKFVFFIFWLLLIMRSFTEPILFPTPLDFFYISLFMIFIKSNRIECKKG